MIAARDQPRHARSIGVDVARSRYLALGAAGGLAAIAGMLYFASVPAGLAPGAFDATRSLDVVAFAVVGGLGSALGAGLGAAALILAGAALPPPWGSVVSGAGVLWVVLFAPAGAAGALTRIRDRLAELFVPNADAVKVAPVIPAPRAAIGAAHVAGADTRGAMQNDAVRGAMVVAFAFAGPSLAGLFGAPQILRDHLGIDPGFMGPWLVLALAAAASIAAVIAWRTTGPTSDLLVVGIVVAAVATFVFTEDAAMTAVVAMVGPVAAGWTLSRLARRTADHVPAHLASAACGLIVASGCGGLVAAGHLAAVAAGNDVLDAGRWSIVYLAIGSAAMVGLVRRVSAFTVAAAVGDPIRSGRRRWTALRVDGLTVDLGGHRILADVTLDVRPGELVALVGANGSGKSTLLRAVAGFVDHAAGRIHVAGENLEGLRPHERAAAGVAFVDGARPVFPDLTVRQNLRVGAYLTHRTEASFSAGLEHVLAIVPQLAPRLGTRAGLLSGGEQRQLAVAQTLFRRPVVLLADELGLGLDRVAQRLVSRLLRDLADDGIAIVAVDHDVDALLAVADRTVAVRDAATVELSDTDSRREEIVPAVFLGSAAR